MNKIVELDDHISPCINCLIKMRCSQVCDNFIIYYVSLKELIKIKLRMIEIEPTTRSGYKIYRDIMLDILHEQKSAHEKLVGHVEDILYNLEESQKRKE